MIRVFLTCFLAVASVTAQTNGANKAASQAAPPAKSTPSPATPVATPPPGPQQVPLDAPVITVHGVCATGDPKSDACQTVITRQQFQEIIAATSPTGQQTMSGALRAFALNYVQILVLGTAAEKAGVEKSPQFVELMQMMRLRALSESYRRFLQEQYKNPSPEEIADYYKQNFDKYQQLGIERIFVPRANPRGAKEGAAAFEQRAQKLAGDIRERAAKGEDMTKLQVEAYKTLDLPPPMTADLGNRHRGTFPSGIDQDVFALKPGQVSKVEIDPSGFTIYKVTSDNTVPLDRMKDEIVREIAQKKAEAAIQSVMAPVHTDLNDQFFSTTHTGPSPIPPRNGTRLPAMPSRPPNQGTKPAETSTPPK